MSMLKIIMGLALSLVLGSTSYAATAATANSAEEMPPPPPFHTMGLSGICATQDNLYVMADGKILQYGLTELNLLKTVSLPEPTPPSSSASQSTEAGEPPMFPPPMAPPHGLWAGDGVLYVLAGPKVYRYSIPALELKTSIDLPQPELPEDED